MSPPPSNSSITTKSTLKSHLVHLKARAEWARSAASQAVDIQTRIEAINNEITVLQKSAKIALVNLGNVSRSLQRAFSDTEILASKKLQARKESLTRIPSGVALLDTVKIHLVFGKEEQTLGEFFDKNEISRAREVCAETHNEVEMRIKELKKTMEEFIHQGEGLKEEVLSWDPDSVQEGGYAREITLISNKIERGMFPLIAIN
jgi:chaperonin cofactor prefoldin